MGLDKKEAKSVTRDQFAVAIGWKRIIWFFGLVNVSAQLPQLWKLVTTHSTEGLSLEMFVIYLFVQVAFSLEGFFTRSRMLLVCLALSAIMTVANIGFILAFRP